ncbi:hypothetical protein [Diaphorobacter nitroreducens]|uniref:hypothetical protein n=1 Tax=Diaphorobacter nitroreducens TaxID=164759 RepID=UPI00289FDEAB|nr:hypothetical protein [Diaphorobacter nitroreducens]
MKRFFVVAVPGGYAVASMHAALGLVARSEHYARDSAEAEAERLNMQAEADLARARSTIAVQRQHAFNERRSVRWFEPDAFA